MGDGAGRGGRGGGGGGGGAQPIRKKEFEQTAADRAIREDDRHGSTIGLRQAATRREDQTQAAIDTATAAGNTRDAAGLRRQLRDESRMDNRAIFMFRNGLPIRQRFFDAAPTAQMTSANRTASARAFRQRHTNAELRAARSLLQADRNRVAGNARNVREANARLNVIDRALRMSRR